MATMKRGGSAAQEAAEHVAIQALSFIAADGERLGRFLAASGIGPHQIRTASAEPGFLVGVLEYVAADETLLLEFAADAGLEPRVVDTARLALGGGWERDIP